MHEHVHERLVEALDLATGLRVVRGRVKVPDTHEVTHTLEEQGGELGSVVRQDCVRGPIHGNPIPAERRRDVRRGDASQGDGAYQLREPVFDDQEEDVPWLGLCQGSEEVRRQAREGVRRREQLEHRCASPWCDPVLGARRTTGHPFVHVRGHGLPVVVAPDGGVHQALP